MIRIITLTVLYASGTALLIVFGSWQLALGVWIMVWAARVEEKLFP